MGDVFDSRKGIDFAALTWAKRVVFEPLKERNIDTHIVSGNHDSYYKNTNAVTSVDLLLNEYHNISVYTEATEVPIGNLPILFIPWINEENRKVTLQTIQDSTCKMSVGHLECRGFMPHRGCVMEDGMDSNIFKNFSLVFSGHYHTRSNDSRVFYIGNPYEMFWNDVADRRGFVILETDTLEWDYVNNPFRMFYNVYYEDTDHQLFDARELENKIVKVIVRKKSDNIKFEKFIDKLYSVGVAELKVIENFQLMESEEFEAEESEDTLSILNRYIEESDTELDKPVIQKLIREIYQEACEAI
jgi:DNA repair exonuclease SbcCD nuclease subunit